VQQPGRLLPRRALPDLPVQSHLHHDRLEPLHVGGPIQRRRDRHVRTRCEPVHAVRGLSPAGAARHRRRLGAGDVQGDHRRGNLRRDLREGADRSAAAGSQRQPPIPPRSGSRGRGRRRTVLLLRRAQRRRGPCSARDAGPGRRITGARGKLRGDPAGRRAGDGGPRLRASPGAPRELRSSTSTAT
jgi:hypothetical protein